VEAVPDRVALFPRIVDIECCAIGEDDSLADDFTGRRGGLLLREQGGTREKDQQNRERRTFKIPIAHNLCNLRIRVLYALTA
jgi:hypothetical protein